jgi:hypothetical protein
MIRDERPTVDAADSPVEGDMPIFGKHHDESAQGWVEPPVPGLAEAMVAQGWTAVTGPPFDGHMEGVVTATTRAMYGAQRHMVAPAKVNIRVGETGFSDVYRGNLAGRAVTVANSWTAIEGENRFATGEVKHVAVCVAELPALLPIACIQPRQFGLIVDGAETPTGNPQFDQRFYVARLTSTVAQVLTPNLQQRIMAHDDWVFRAERYLFGCISRGRFDSVDEVGRRISEVMGIVSAIPTSVLPDHVDHSEDDLLARISRLTTIDEALALLQSLTPEDRQRLAQSGTPLAVMADVQTPEEALARFQGLDPQKKMELMAMFMRVKDGTPRR